MFISQVDLTLSFSCRVPGHSDSVQHVPAVIQTVGQVTLVTGHLVQLEECLRGRVSYSPFSEWGSFHYLGKGEIIFFS